MQFLTSSKHQKHFTAKTEREQAKKIEKQQKNSTCESLCANCEHQTAKKKQCAHASTSHCVSHSVIHIFMIFIFEPFSVFAVVIIIVFEKSLFCEAFAILVGAVAAAAIEWYRTNKMAKKAGMKRKLKWIILFLYGIVGSYVFCCIFSSKMFVASLSAWCDVKDCYCFYYLFTKTLNNNDKKTI